MYRSFEHKFNVGDTVTLKQQKFDNYTVIEIHGVYDSAETYSNAGIQYLVRRKHDLVLVTLNEVELEAVVNPNNEVTDEVNSANANPL